MKRKTVFSMLLAAAVLLCACSGTPSAQSVPAESTSSAGSQTDLQQWAGGALTLISEGGNGPDGVTTEQGYYELEVTGTNLQNILYTDFETGTRVFLCNRPECTHRDESCTSVLTGGGYLFPLNGKIGIFQPGGTSPELPDSERKCRIYQMNTDGSERKELCALAPDISPFSGLATDGKFLYFIAVVIPETENGSEAYELVRVSLQDGAATTLKTFENNLPYLGGAFEDKLLLEYSTEKDGSYVYQCSVYSLSTNEETFFYENPVQGFVRNNKVYVIDPQEKKVQEVSADGTTREWAIDLTIPENAYIDNGGEEFVPSGYLAFTVLADGSGQRYLLNKQTGELTQSTLNYTWYDGSERPIYVLTQIGERLLVINKSELANMEYLEKNGELSVRESILEGYAFLSVQDYLSSTPNYTPVNDMIGALFTQ